MKDLKYCQSSRSGPFSSRTIKDSCCWSTTGTRYPCEMVRKRARRLEEGTLAGCCTVARFGNVIAAANQACWNLFQIHRRMKTVPVRGAAAAWKGSPGESSEQHIILDCGGGCVLATETSPGTLQGHSVTIDDAQDRL